MTQRINRTLFELWTGILIFGILCEFIVFFVNDKTSYSICLLIGVACAMLAALHMWWSIDSALSLDEGGAAKKMSINYMLRYLALALVLAICGMVFGSYVLATFLGIAGIKAGAYLHPLTKRISTLIYGEEILPPIIEFNENEEEVSK